MGGYNESVVCIYLDKTTVGTGEASSKDRLLTYIFVSNPRRPRVRTAPHTTKQFGQQVESLTLRRDDGTFESACNLLRPRETTPAMVLAVAEKRAASLGFRVVDHYETGLSEEGAMSAIISQFSEERKKT